jgi:acyl-CoA dehydrogenase
LRKLFATFGMDAMARDRFKSDELATRAIAAGEACDERQAFRRWRRTGMSMIPIIELCRVCPGMVTAMGVSMGLTSAAIMSKGTIAQKERWALDLLTMDKIGAWAITEPGSGSDAFGSMRVDGSARRRRLRAERVQDLHHERSRTPTSRCSSASSTTARRRQGSARSCRSCSIVGMPGFEQSKPLRKMGMHSSPTGELFLDDVRVERDRLIGETEDLPAGGRDGAKATFQQERCRAWRRWRSASSRSVSSSACSTPEGSRAVRQADR